MHPVFLMKINPEGYNTVDLAAPFLTEKMNLYIDTHKKGAVEYTDPQTDNAFTLNNFDAAGLKGIYDDFYTYTNVDEKNTIVSLNEIKLKGFCGYINRLTHW
jgi:hypothetical protein